jgi:rod shape-determining protein MreB
LKIEDAVMETLSQTPPELAADIYNTGIYLAGGGSMLEDWTNDFSKNSYLFTLLKIH